MNVCLYMYILFYIISDCVCFMDYNILTADGDLIVLVYMILYLKKKHNLF